VAVETVGRDVEFEISLRNVDKPNLDFLSLQERLQGFTAQSGSRCPMRVWVTNAPRFVDKSKLFPGATFIVGIDTARRIVDPKYAGSVWDVMRVFEDQGTTFQVFGRQVGGTYDYDMTSFPPRFRAISVQMSKLNNAAMSSTAIRQLRKESNA